MTFRIAGSGQHARQQEERTSAVAFFDDATMRGAWPGDDPPTIDFQKEMVIVLFAGSRPTGGWSIVPRGVSLSADNWLIVDAAIRKPPPDAIVTQAFTSPWIAIAVGKRTIEGVRWHPE